MVDSASRYCSDSEKTRIRRKWFGRNRPSRSSGFGTVRNGIDELIERKGARSAAGLYAGKDRAAPLVGTPSFVGALFGSGDCPAKVFGLAQRKVTRSCSVCVTKNRSRHPLPSYQTPPSDPARNKDPMFTL